MPHDVNIVATIAVGFVLASIFGYIADRLRLPALVGFVVAGIFIGPFTPGFVADTAMAGQLAEIGIILLMFGVGLHFSASDLLAVRGVVVPGALGQIALAPLLAIGLCWFWGWSWGASLVFGTSLSVASTVVLLRALESRRALNTVNGRIAVGWLIVEDLFVVLVLVVLATDRAIPNTRLAPQVQPHICAVSAASPVAAAIWTTAPGIAIRCTAIRSGMEKCSPTPNIISMTPISASSEVSAMSATKPGVAGPMTMPARR